MNQESFCYWLQGFFELSESNSLTEKQVLIIKDHLALVFSKVTPDRSTEIKKEVPPYGLDKDAPTPQILYPTPIPIAPSPSWPGQSPWPGYPNFPGSGITCVAPGSAADPKLECSSGDPYVTSPIFTVTC